MLIEWINKKGNRHLILFFNGWGMDTNILGKMDNGDFDVLMVFGYYSPELVLPLFGEYDKVTLVAWSMGVWAAETVFGAISPRPNLSIAINGTSTPINARTGITPEIFEKTLENWTEATRTKFYKRVWGDQKNSVEWESLLPSRSANDQREELLAIRRGVEGRNARADIWGKAIIGERDTIFTKRNQIEWWNDKTEMRVTGIAHCPFPLFSNWEMIIGL